MYKNVKDILPPVLSAGMIGKPYLLSNTSLRTTDWSQEFRLLDQFDKLESVQFEALHPDSEIYHVHNLLSEKQCSDILNRSELLDFQTVSYGDDRNNSRLVVFDEKFSDYLWSRINVELSKHTVAECNRPLGFDVMRGEWKLSGVNEAFRFNKYDSNNQQFFGVHRDSQFCPSGDKRSVYTLLVYLNDNFSGGETIFYIPKNTSLVCKGLAMEDEIRKNGGLRNGYISTTFKPICGDAVIFKQNIIHEGTPLAGKNESKFVLKSDIMSKRIGEKLGFKISEREQVDYFNCLELFRNAQNIELKEKNDEASIYYEQCLSIRYSYPAVLINKDATCVESACVEGTNEKLSMNNENKDLKSSAYTGEDFFETTGDELEFDTTVKSNISPFSIFPIDVWHLIMKYLITDAITLKYLVSIFPELLKERKRVERLSIIPKVVHHTGIITQFSFPSTTFLFQNQEACARVAAIFAVYLLGNTDDQGTYVVNYNRDTKAVSTLLLNDLLIGVYYQEPVKGSIFRIKQQRSNEKIPLSDFYHSVDRRFMATYLDVENVGIDLQSELRVTTTIDSDQKGSSEDDSDEEDSDDDSYLGYTVFYRYNNQSKFVQSFHKQFTLRTWDQRYRLFRDDMSRSIISEEEKRYPGNYKLVDKYQTYQMERRILQGYRQKMSHQLENNTYQSRVQHRKRKPIIGGALVRKSVKRIGVKSHDYCDCSMRAYLTSKITDNSKTYMFNHFIADFSKYKLDVCDECDDGKDCMVLRYLQERVSKQLDGFDCIFYTVNIKDLEDIVSSFNHASCQCMFPNYKVDEYVALSNYPFLDHIHVAFARERINPENSFVFTAYVGIVAL